MCAHALVAAAALLATAAASCGEADRLSVAAQLQNEIFCGYNTDHRPVKQHDDAVHVKVAIALKYFTFDFLEETLTIHTTVSMSWKDDYLKWEPRAYENITLVSVKSGSIWTPSMSLFNADAERVGAEHALPAGISCHVKYDGTVTCAPDLEHTAVCSTSLRNWPYDTQNCKLYFGSWIYNGEQVNFTLAEKNPIAVEDCKDGPGWKLVNYSSKWIPNVLMNNSYPVLKFELALRRSAAGLAAAALAPGAAAVLLPLMAAGAARGGEGSSPRLPLAVFGVFAHLTWLMELGYSAPRHGAESPRLLLLARASLALAAAGVAAALALSWLRGSGPASPPPRRLAALLRVARASPARYFVFADLEGDGLTLTPDNQAQITSAKSEWLQLANILDTLFFIVITIIYAVLLYSYLPSQ